MGRVWRQFMQGVCVGNTGAATRLHPPGIMGTTGWLPQLRPPKRLPRWLLGGSSVAPRWLPDDTKFGQFPANLGWLEPPSAVGATRWTTQGVPKSHRVALYVYITRCKRRSRLHLVIYTYR